MITIVLITIILLGINIANYYYLRNEYKLLNPLSVIIYVWLPALITHRVYFGISEYSIQAYICILVGLVALAIGFWFFAKIYVSDRKSENIYNMKALRKVIEILTILELVRLVYIALVVYKIAGSWELFLYNTTYVRNLYLIRENSLLQTLFEFFTGANAMLGYVIIGVFLALKERGSKRYIVIWTSIELMIALLTMSKMCFIVYIIVVAVTFFNNLGSFQEQKKLLVKFIPFLGGFIFAFLLLIGMQRNYGKDGNIVLIVFNKAIFYFSGSIEALAKYMSLYKSDYDFGCNTFIIIERILARLGVAANSEALAHGEFIDIAYEATNVYTWFRTFYLDYSYLGFVIVPFFLGSVAGVFYTPRKHNLFLDVCLSWISCVFALSFYAYMWGQTIYIFVLVYAFLIHKLFGRKIYQEVKT